MNKIKNGFSALFRWLANNRTNILVAGIVVILLTSLLLRQLLTLTGGLSASEQTIATTPIGWQGIMNNAFFLPIKLLWSAGFYFFDQGGALVSRLPSVIFGAIGIVTFGLIVKAWHGARIAVLLSLLFACSAWTLHVSRYAGIASLYLAAMPILIYASNILKRAVNWQLGAIYIIILGGLLLLPGLIWLVLFTLILQRDQLKAVWKAAKLWWQKAALVGAAVAPWPLLLLTFLNGSDRVLTWLNLPANFGSLIDFGQRLVAVPIQLFVKGPDSPALWLGRLPILDIFTSTLVILGLYYYVRQWQSSRSKELLAYILLTIFVISLGGPAGNSLVIPLFYLVAAAGCAQLLRDWLKRFPNNPIARGFGISLLTLVVGLSCFYNLQHYFVAWPYNQATMRQFTIQN